MIKAGFTSFFLLYIVVVTLSCNNRNARHENTDTTSSAATAKNVADGDSVAYSYRVVYEHSPYFYAHEGGLDTTYFLAEYPKSQNEIFNQMVTESLGLDADHRLEDLAAAFLGEYNEYIEGAENPEEIFSWHQKTKINVITNHWPILVLQSHYEDYTGGAHGNHALLFHNFDLEKSTKIDIDKLILPDKRKEFLNIAEKYFRKVENLKENESLDDVYFFDEGKFALSDNFGLRAEGIEFLYNIYEIKPYSEGITRFTIPYDAVAHLLSDTGKSYFQRIQ